MITLILVISVIFTMYMYSTRNFDFWKKRGIFYLKPIPFFGNLMPIAFLRKPIGPFLADLYRENKDKPYFGIFFANHPCLIINDLELIEEIVIKNFQRVSSRIFAPPAELDPLGAKSLFALDGDAWKVTRSKLSPAFTSTKLKSMFNAMAEVTKSMEKELDSVSSIEVADLSVRFTIDLIAAAVFGLKGNAIEDPDNDQMRNISREMFNGSVYQAMKLNFIFLTPHLMNTLKMTTFSEHSYDFMRSLAKSVVDERTKYNIRRNDFMDMLIEQKKNGGWEMKDGSHFELEGDNLAAQIFMFVTAAYETASSSIVFCFYELALNHKIQEKVRKEINDVIRENGGELSFECLKEMKYIDMVMNETYRKYPPFPFLDRTCTADFKLPGTNTIIPKGTFIMLPMLGLQNDSKYWPNPETFDPERFRNPENLKGKPFFPFGIGLRTCLGMRLAHLQLKLGLIASMRNHQLTTVKQDVIFDPRRFTTLPVNDITLYVKSLK